MTLISAHLAGLLEPLFFLPAFVMVLWSIVTTRRRETNQPDQPRSTTDEP